MTPSLFLVFWMAAFVMVVVQWPYYVVTATATTNYVTIDDDTTTDNELLYEPERIAGRIDTWTTPPRRQSPDDDTCTADNNNFYAPILQVVAVRDYILGCHSFHEYLSPRFHTVFVLPHEFALQLQVNELVETVTAQQSAGAHLFLVKGAVGGEMLARRVGERFIARELEPRQGVKIHYLSTVMCDIHQLPKEHDMFVPFEKVVLQMMESLRLSQRYRQRGEYLETNYDHPLCCGNKCQMEKVLAINTLLFHDVRDRTTLRWLHGEDFFSWGGGEGWRNNKPQHLVEQNLPWLVDNSHSFEDHMTLYDLELLRTIQHELLMPYSQHFIEGDTLIGRLANKYNMTVIRNHDLMLHINFGTRPDEIRFPPHVNIDWVKTQNFFTAAAFRNPRQVSEDWDKAFYYSQIENPYGRRGRSVRMLCDMYNAASWLPNTFHKGGRVAEPNVQLVLRGLLWYLGYVFVEPSPDNNDVLEFHLDGFFPDTRLLRILPSTQQVNHEEWTQLLSFRSSKEEHSFSLVLCGYQVTECGQRGQLRLLPEHHHTLVIPLDATLEDITLDSRCDMWSEW